MRSQARFGVLVLLGVLVPGAAWALPPGGGLQAIIPLPGGIADPSVRAGYVTSAQGGIEALDLITGDVLWESHEAELPLLVAGERLYAQAGTRRNRLRVLVYDLPRKGEVVLESEPVVFPAWVMTGDAPGHSFQADWRLEAGQLVLAWKARSWYAGKEKATVLVETQERHQAEGVVKIDLQTGRNQHFPTQAPAVASGVPEPKELEKKSVRWQGLVGGQYRAVVLGQDGPMQKAYLLTWDRAGVLQDPPKILKEGKQLTVLSTLDNRMVALRDALPSPDQRGPGVDLKKYGWTLVALDTGKQIAHVAYEPGTQAMTILGPRLFLLQSGPVRAALNQPYQNSRSIKALDVKTGHVLWEHAVASKTSY